MYQRLFLKIIYNLFMFTVSFLLYIHIQVLIIDENVKLMSQIIIIVQSSILENK